VTKTTIASHRRGARLVVPMAAGLLLLAGCGAQPSSTGEPGLVGAGLGAMALVADADISAEADLTPVSQVCHSDALGPGQSLECDCALQTDPRLDEDTQPKSRLRD